jgi:Divergent InlB B-repeat domain
MSAHRAAGWKFTGWSGACSGTKGCAVRMSAARAVSATFQPK